MIETLGDKRKAPSRLLRQAAKKVLPRSIIALIQRMRGHVSHEIPVGSVRFGDLRRLVPISPTFGFDRGTPIDRYYIESFLSQNTNDIRGCVLEIGDDRYTRRFGRDVARSNILCIEDSNPNATFVGDLAQSNILPDAEFDCVILTQTLQYIFDVRSAIATLFRALKPGGVLLLTVPSLRSQIDGSAWGVTWYWWFTPAAIRRLLEERFPSPNVTVDCYGNIFVATAFHFGLALEELERDELNTFDPEFPIIVAARAIKPMAYGNRSKDYQYGLHPVPKTPS